MIEGKGRDFKEELARENLRLKEAVAELAILNDIATAISSVSSLNEVIDLIVKKCVTHLRVEQCTVTLLSEDEPDTPLRTFIRRADTSREVMPCRLDEQLTGWMLKNRRPLVTNDLRNDRRFHVEMTEDYPVRSMLSVPLILKGSLIGSINVFNKKSGENFSEENKKLLAIIASQSAQVIENARLYEEEKQLKIMQEEMNLAYNIQMDLLPKGCPKIRGYDIFGKSIPARTVGGDYFDFITDCGDDFTFCVGDVVGKGIPAALLMANIQATLRGQVANLLDPLECIKRANELLYRSTNEDKFVTLFLGKLNQSTHTITYCNAGHNYPMLFRRSGVTEKLMEGGLVLGAVEGVPYSSGETRMDKGDVLVIFSDGVTEAFNREEEQFGESRLKNLIIENLKGSAERISSEIVSAVGDFAGPVQQSDDITLMIIKRSG